MISREEAEQVVIQERSGEEREVRIKSLERCQMSQENPVHEYSEMGYVDWQEDGWSCFFEWRDKLSDGSWGSWSGGGGHCYVIEAKPGPYVVK